MNNTFSFNRFGKLLAMDGKKYLRNFGITLAILCSLNIGFWLLSLAFDIMVPTFLRWMVIYVAVFLSCILVPAKAFGDINLPRDGVRYAMLPVSNTEKYVSYILYCILTPFAVALLSYGIDSLLTVLPFGGFHNYIRSLGVVGTFTDFFTQLSDPSGVLDPSDLTEDYYDALKIMNRISNIESVNYLVGFLFTSGFFMMGNLLFKTHKTGKTFGIMMGFSYILSTLIQVVMISSNFFNFTGEANIDSISDLFGSLMWTSIIINVVLTIALYIGIFFKLKTQKY